MPENPRGHCSPGRPRAGHTPESLLGGAAAEPLDLVRCLGQSKISVRPDVGATESHEQVDVCGPRSDAGNQQQARSRFVVLEAREVAQREPAIDDAGGEHPTIRCFLAGKTGFAEPGFAEPCDSTGRNSAGGSLQSRIGRAGGGKGDLLLKNDADKRCEAGPTRPEWGWPPTPHDACEVPVPGPEFPDASKQRNAGQWRRQGSTLTVAQHAGRREKGHKADNSRQSPTWHSDLRLNKTPTSGWHDPVGDLPTPGPSRELPAALLSDRACE